MKKVALISPLEDNLTLEAFSRIINVPRHGTIIIATVIRDAGYSIRVFCEYVRCKIDWEYVFQADYICFSLLSYNALRGYDMADMIRSRTKAPVIIGGSHPSVLAEDCLEHCDYAVRNEGDDTIVELLNALDLGAGVEGIKGISYRNSGGKIIHNPDREFMENIDRISDISLIENYTPISGFGIIKNFFKTGRLRKNAQVLQTTRGCPHSCVFCFGRRELGNKYRMRSIESVIEDIKRKLKILKSNWFYVIDNEFTINKKRTRELLHRIIEEFGNTLMFVVFARIEVSKDEELLDLMKKAGVYMIYLGIESINDNTLELYNKKQKLDDIKQSISTIYKHKLAIFASLAFGSDEDTQESVKKTFDFLIEYDMYAICVLALYDFPFKEKTLGIPQLFPDNRFIHNDWRFYNGSFVIHYPKKMKPSTLQKEIMNGIGRFYRFSRRYKTLILKRDLYHIGQYWAFKPLLKTMKSYIRILERYECGLYDEHEILIEAKLPVNDNPALKRYLPL